MKRMPLFAALAAVFIASTANAATLSVVGASTKVCQLIGDTDWETNLPTAAQTLTNFGLDSVDLGFPVDSDPDRLYFLFGDAFPLTHPPSNVPPDDALGWTTRTKEPDKTNCLDLEIATSAPKTFAHPKVVPDIEQGSFNVPSGGVYLDKSIYAFFWTNHCVIPGTLLPEPNDPLDYPAATGLCPQTYNNNSIGNSVLARASPADPVLFHQTYPAYPVLKIPLSARMPSGFVYVSAALPRADDEHGFPAHERYIPVFGVARYRASIPYLALAPRDTFGDPATWSFYAGHKGPDPIFITRPQWESGHNASGRWVPPPDAEIYDAVPTAERCVGEHSLTWNEPLRTWLFVYNCAPWTIEARTAPNPWGPWSPPTVLLQATPTSPLVCTLIMSVTGCPNLVRRNYWPGMPGIFYAPFVMNRYTREVPPSTPHTRDATIYWLLSTWNPYVVTVMRSTLELAP